MAGVNSDAGLPAARPGRNARSHPANSSAGSRQAISSASASAGDRKSCPDGSQLPG